MAVTKRYKLSTSDVEFSNIQNTNIRTGQKISVGKYEIDENGNIVFNKPIINAIDIDWNNATVDGIDETINTSADVLSQISKIKNVVSNIKIPKSVWELSGSSQLFTIDEFNRIKDDLKGKSAYDIAKEYAEENGIYFPYTNEIAWINSLKGAPGEAGESAYDIARRTYMSMGLDFPYEDEIDWMSNIIETTSEEHIESIIDEKIRGKQNNLIPGTGIDINDNVISATANTWIKITDN